MKKLGFWLMHLPQTDPDDDGSVDIPAVKQMADAFLAKGFTYFDTAALYHRGNSEIAFREAVAKRYPRSAYTITDKLSLLILKEPEDMPAFLPGSWSGWGLSMWITTCFMIWTARFTRHPEMEYVQLPLNYLDWEDASVQSRLCYEVALKHRKPVIAMEPVKGGNLAHVPEQAAELLKAQRPEMSLVSWAIRFAATPKNVMIVLSGMRSLTQMKDNMRYMEHFHPLNEEEQETVAKAAAILKESIAI